MPRAKATALSEVSNDAKRQIQNGEPYSVFVKLTGTVPFLFHRWSNEAVEEKARAAKNSRTKKEDNVESYVYRNDKGELCIPSEYIRQSLIHAAKYLQDPRSPRKSAMDLFKAGIVCLNELCSLGTKEWDYLDRRRVVIQRNAVTRVRPAMLPGWIIQSEMMILLPEYLTPDLVHDTLVNAGRLIAMGDFRPTFGRFNVSKFETREN